MIRRPLTYSAPTSGDLMPALETLATVAAIAILAALVLALGAYVIARLRDEPGAEWTPAAMAEMTAEPDPLDPATVIPGYELVDARLFEELTQIHALRLDWAPPTFSQEWQLAGETMRQLGDTTEMQKVVAA